MKTFKDLQFKPHPNTAPELPNGDLGIVSRIYFENGYGASVVRSQYTFGGSQGLYELAVVKGNAEESSLCYDTPVSDDVLGYLTEEEVTTILEQIQKL